MKKAFQRILCFCFLIFVALKSQGASIHGLLLERGTKTPLAGVNVYVLPSKGKATTGPGGDFHFSDIPEGPVQIVVNQSGYKKLEKDWVIPSEAALAKNSIVKDQQQERVDVTLYLQRESYSGFETTIIAQKQKKDPVTKTLTQQQFLNLPGSNGDPVKAVQNLPGVNRAGGFSSQVIIQGSAPGDTIYDIEGHRVPLIFHFGGLSSVIMPESVDSVDYLAAGYGPEYSRALGGIVSLKTKNPDSNGRPYKGFYFIDTLKSGVQLEGSIDEKSTFLVSGRYSYIGFIAKQLLKEEKDFSITVAPEFADLTMIYKNKINEKDDFKMTTVASRDVLSFLLKEPVRQDPSIRGNFRNDTTFFRLIPKWHRRIDEKTEADLSLGLGQDQILVDVGDKYFRLKSYNLTARGEWEKNVTSNWKTTVGLDNQYNRYQIDVRLPIPRGGGGVNNPIAVSELRQVNLSGRTFNLGTYWRNEWVPYESSPWTLIPSLRLDHFRMVKETFLAPRFTAKYKSSDFLQWRFSQGTYFQPPAEQDADPDFGNPDIKSPRADHYYLGFENDFRGQSDRGFIFSMGYFRRDFSRLVVQSSSQILREGNSVPEMYNNSGRGLAHGLEFLLRSEFRSFTGWISYTLSRSVRWDESHSEYSFEYDQTHNLNIVGSYEFENDYRLSGRWRYVTGNPTTPIIGSYFDADNDVYVPRRGVFYSERKSPFQQFDLRLDKKFLSDRNIYSVYLDIQNILNHQNPEGIRYAYDYSEKQDIMGLPMLVSLGFKGEF